MKVRVTCSKTFFDSQGGVLYLVGRQYDVLPRPEFGDFFLFEAELRAELRKKQAARLGRKPVDDKAALAEARKLADIAHKSLLPAEPTTLHEMAGTPVQIPTDRPIALSQITDPNSDFLG